MSEWSLVYDRYDPSEQGLREALCTTGNGYFCTRGAFPWVKADETHYPGTYVAGGYNRLVSTIGGHELEHRITSYNVCYTKLLRSVIYQNRMKKNN